jgi:hypothetical protein
VGEWTILQNAGGELKREDTGIVHFTTRLPGTTL